MAVERRCPPQLHKVHLNRTPFFVNNLYCGIGVFVSFHSVTPWFHHQLESDAAREYVATMWRSAEPRSRKLCFHQPAIFADIDCGYFYPLTRTSRIHSIQWPKPCVRYSEQFFVSFSSTSLTMNPSLSAWTQRYHDLTPLRNLCKLQIVFAIAFCSTVGTAVLHKPSISAYT